MKKGLGFVGIVLLAMLLVVAVRTASFGIEPTPVDAGQPPEWDEAAALARLQGALRIPTIAAVKQEDLDVEAFEAFHSYLRQQYPLTFSRLNWHRIEGYSLLGEWKGESDTAQPIMLLAHMDVVPVQPGTESEWRFPAFDGTVADGFIWGRGALDDKSSLIGWLEAAEKLLAEGFTPPRTVYFGFGHDEEVGGAGARAMSDWLAERGVRLGFLLDEGGFVTKGLIPGIDGRVALIGPAEKGYTSIQLTARGLGGHSSMPPRHTAVGQIARAITRLENNPFPADLSYTVDTFEYLGDEAPLLQRMIFANLWLFGPLAEKVMSDIPSTNAGIRTTTAATMMEGSPKDNVLPIIAKAVINFRILPGDTVESVYEHVTKVIDDPNIVIEPYTDFSSNPTKVAPIDGGAYETLSRIIRQVRPDTVVVPRLVVGATDARNLEPVSDASYRFLGLEVGPEQLAGMHGTNEHVSTESFFDSLRMYYLLLKNADEL